MVFLNHNLMGQQIIGGSDPWFFARKRSRIHQPYGSGNHGTNQPNLKCCWPGLGPLNSHCKDGRFWDPIPIPILIDTTLNIASDRTQMKQPPSTFSANLTGPRGQNWWNSGENVLPRYGDTAKMASMKCRSATTGHIFWQKLLEPAWRFQEPKHRGLLQYPVVSSIRNSLSIMSVRSLVWCM